MKMSKYITLEAPADKAVDTVAKGCRSSHVGRSLLAPLEQRKNPGSIGSSRKIFLWTLATILVVGLLAGFTTSFLEVVPPHLHRPHPRQLYSRRQPDRYTVALNKALMFFNAQRSGKLPKNNNASWRGNSCLHDGEADSLSPFKDLSGGYYDAGDAIKFNFPQSFAITMLSWSVIEYSGKYKAARELNHVKDIIKWGTDYFLKTFDSNSDSIDRMVSQFLVSRLESGIPHKGVTAMITTAGCARKTFITTDQTECHACSDLAADMAAALASASIVFKDNKRYSKKLVRGAKTLFKFSRQHRGRYSTGTEADIFYNSTCYWDEFVWGAAWLFYATGEESYLRLTTEPSLAKRAGAFGNGPEYGVLSWDNKLPAAQVLLTRLRIFLSPVYPYEEMLSIFPKQTSIIMCSYLPYFRSFNRTKGGMIQLNQGRPQNLQFVVNAAFLANVFSDYLKAADIPGWHCGPNFYTLEHLKEFARTQINYILGKNPRKMSYVVGYGKRYPRQVHHRGASIPKNKIKNSCKGGWKWRDSKKTNPNTIVGAMVAGPDKHDGFHDVRANYNYTEPTLAGNAGLVAALVGLSGGKSIRIDTNTIFSAVLAKLPPPPAPAPRNPRVV